MCLGMNPDQLAPGERGASTSNRNFEGRQGKGGRTHLVSPPVAAATAVLGGSRRPPISPPPSACRAGESRWSSSRHQGTAMPLRRSNVDTDQIIPAVYLKRVSRTGFEDGLFAAWRRDPDFVLNRPEYAGASILVAGPDFGTGSSREHAVWALQNYGFRAVLSAALRRHLPWQLRQGRAAAAVVDQDVIEQLWSVVEAEPGDRAVTVDLSRPRVDGRARSAASSSTTTSGGGCMEGLDDIGLTLRHEPTITAFEASRPGFLPTSSDLDPRAR